MIRCARCLYPDTKVDLHFDADGVCSACRNYDKRKLIDWKAREGELLSILETGKNDSGYDVIVPSSGGKDSHWQVLKLIDLGVRPLVVTATTCHLTKIGRANIDNLARYATTIEVSPNRAVRAKLNRLGLEMVADVSWPEHASIFSVPFQVAAAYGIPLMFFGECPQSQYGGPPGTEEAMQLTPAWRAEHGGFLGLRPADFIGIENITERDMRDYELPPQEALDRVGVKAYFLGQFYEWDSHRNARVAAEHGMLQKLPTPANWWAAENLDCTFTSVHDAFLMFKYGYGRVDAQLSVDIRAGLIERDEAMKIASERRTLLDDYYAGENIWDALAGIGVHKEYFWHLVDRYQASLAA